MKAYRDLRPFPLSQVVIGDPGVVVITMAEGQWDGVLAAAYERGWILLEVDDDEQPVRAYRRATDQATHEEPNP
jgi:hypothetical protein